MFGFKRKSKNKDICIALVSAACDLADSLLRLVPADRPVTMEEFQAVERQVLEIISEQCRKTLSPSAYDLVGKTIDDRVRQAFSRRFYANAPIDIVLGEGRA